MKSHAVDKDTVNLDRELAKIKASLLKKYHIVFKDELDKNDRLDIEPLKLELIDNYDDVPPTNHMTPFATPRHLQEAADKELNKLLAAGVLEKVEHPTEWCSRGFFVQKNTYGGTPKVRLVRDLRGVNKILKRVGHLLDGSSHILKRLEPSDKFYAVCDLSMGYHQLELHEDSKDLFSIVLPQGKFRYACMPQGAGPSSDLFNIHTDPQVRGCKGIYKISCLLPPPQDIWNRKWKKS